MAEEDDSQKTEDPSDRKLAKAREKGQVAVSQEVKSWAILFGGVFGLLFMAPFMMRWTVDLIRPFIEAPHAIALDFGAYRQAFTHVVLGMGLVLAPFVGLMVLLAVAGSMGQVGLMWAPDKVKFDLSKIDPMKGVKRLFSMRSLVEFLKSLLKLVVVGFVSFSVALPLLADLELMPGMDISETLERLHGLAIRLAAATVAVMTAIAVFDFVFQKYQHTKQMRMTKQEVKDEHKNAEGDPHVKARIRRLRVERARQRMMAAVPHADVVVTNPTHFAVAMEYKMETMHAPKVVAKGQDLVAVRIRQVAEENEVPIVENPPLARALFATVELDQEIPPEHYKAVAEIIGYVMRLRGELRD